MQQSHELLSKRQFANALLSQQAEIAHSVGLQEQCKNLTLMWQIYKVATASWRRRASRQAQLQVIQMHCNLLLLRLCSYVLYTVLDLSLNPLAGKQFIDALLLLWRQYGLIGI